MAKPERQPVDKTEFADKHASILEKIIPDEGLVLPEDFEEMSGTTGLIIRIYDFDGLGSEVDISGAVALVYPELEGVFENKIVLKMPGNGEHPYFQNGGLEGSQTVIRETAVDQRVLDSGFMPGALGLGRIENERLFRDCGDEGDERMPAMVMLFYGPDTDFGAMMTLMSGAEKESVMRQAVDILFAFEREMNEEDAEFYVGSKGFRKIMEDTFRRAMLWYKDSDVLMEAPLGEIVGSIEDPVVGRAAGVFLTTYEDIMEDDGFLGFLEAEAGAGAFVDSHGDIRLHDNASIITDTNLDLKLRTRDPVRLYWKENGWTDFHLTHRDFQLGLLVGRLYAEGEIGAVGDAMEHYFSILKEGKKELDADNFKSKLTDEEKKMVGLSLCYGLFVEALVGNNGEDDLSHYWRAVEEISQNDFLGW